MGIKRILNKVLKKDAGQEIDTTQEILERLCNLERVMVDSQMKEVLERLQNIENGMITRLTNVENETKETLERLCNLERVLVDGQMPETLERLRNIEDEMGERLSHIEEKEDWLMQNMGIREERKIRIKLFRENEDDV